MSLIQSIPLQSGVRRIAAKRQKVDQKADQKIKSPLEQLPDPISTYIYTFVPEPGLRSTSKRFRQITEDREFTIFHFLKSELQSEVSKREHYVNAIRRAIRVEKNHLLALFVQTAVIDKTVQTRVLTRFPELRWHLSHYRNKVVVKHIYPRLEGESEFKKKFERKMKTQIFENKAFSIREAIGEKKLKTMSLSLSKLELKEMPPELLRIDLDDLNLSDNWIEKFNSEFLFMDSLTIDLDQNRIRSLPRSLLVAIHSERKSMESVIEQLANNEEFKLEKASLDNFFKAVEGCYHLTLLLKRKVKMSPEVDLELERRLIKKHDEDKKKEEKV